MFDRAVQIVDGIDHAAYQARRARRAAGQAYRGTSQLAGGARGRTGTIVSGELVHGDGDREAAIAQIEREAGNLLSDLKLASAAPGLDPARAESIFGWLTADVIPTLLEWAAFRDGQAAGWSARFATQWQTYVDWQDRFKRLRELARAHGIRLGSPEPSPLPATVFERGEQGRGRTGEILWTALKVVVLGAVGITGIVTLYSVGRDLVGSRRERLAREQAQAELAKAQLAEAHARMIAEPPAPPALTERGE